MTEINTSTSTPAGPGNPATPPVGRDTPKPMIEFTEEQASSLLAYTRACVEAAVTGCPTDDTLPAGLDAAPAFGIFVTLLRGKTLRACRGRWGDTASQLGRLLADVARDTATHDPRFPSIDPDELPFLTVDVSLMHDPAEVVVPPDDRASAVCVGTHGLYLQHPRGRGLLLPNVATEAGWDAPTFLNHLANKAGLPVDAWRDPATHLLTFKTRLLVSKPSFGELDVALLSPASSGVLLRAAQRRVRGVSTPIDDPLLNQKFDARLGVHLLSSTAMTSTAFGSGRSLAELLNAAVDALLDEQDETRDQPCTVTRVTILHTPVRLRAREYPDRHHTVAHCAIHIRTPERSEIVLPIPRVPGNPIADALSAVRLNINDWLAGDHSGQVRLTAYHTHVIRIDESVQDNASRPPAVAGRFYPADAGELQRQVDAHTTQAGAAKTEHCRAVMLPHAGWVFCGGIIAKTLARVCVPQVVVVIGPKHTPNGPGLSVASHERWLVPGGSVPIETALVRRLAASIPNMHIETEAHRDEHGTEVLLPFLQRAQPRVSVVPMVIGQVSYDQTQGIAEGLAAALKAHGLESLLVISSDMNHFATDKENRRLDKLAIDAMMTGNPRQLYEVCTRHQISMCGLLPAVIVMRALALSTTPIIELVSYTTSAKAGAGPARVVGYAGAVLH